MNWFGRLAALMVIGALLFPVETGMRFRRLVDAFDCNCAPLSVSKTEATQPNGMKTSPLAGVVWRYLKKTN